MARVQQVGGLIKPGFEKVSETFRKNLQSGLEKGGSFAAYYRGDLVVHIWGGYCDQEARRLWDKDTLSTFYSSTKAVAAFVVAHLSDRGLLNYNERVCKYWPDFAQNGKENVTVEQLVSNQAGLISLDEPFWLSELRDDPRGLSRKLAAQKPFWTPGTNFGYHPLTFGLYLDQIVRHVDKRGRSLSQYFKEEMAEPFDIEFYIGLPKSLFYRGTRIQLIGNAKQEDFLAEFRGDLDLLLKTRDNPKDFKDVRKINIPDNRELPVPSTHGHGTAASLAKFFGILGNGGTLNGKRLMSLATITQFTKPIVAGIDCCFGIDSAWSLGNQLTTVIDGDGPPTYIFGHGGYGGQYAAADLKYKVGFAYTTNFLDPLSSYTSTGDERLNSLYNALYNCIRDIENVTVPRLTFTRYTEYEKYLKERRSKM